MSNITRKHPVKVKTLLTRSLSTRVKKKKVPNITRYNALWKRMSLLFTFVQLHVQQNREPLKCSVERFSRLYKKSISYGFLNWTLLYYKKSWGQHWGNKQLCQKIFKIYNNYDNVSITLDKRVKIFIRKSFQNNQLSP